MKIYFNENIDDEEAYKKIQEVEETSSKKWYQEIEPDPTDFPTVTDEVWINLKEEAKKCLDSEAAAYKIRVERHNKDQQWMKTVLTKGTTSDQIAAYTVLIQDKPVYNLDNIRHLIGMIKVGKKKENISIIETVTELFLEDLLRPDVKLKAFQERPLSKLNDISSGNSTTRRKYLSYWYFEDQLREVYTSFVMALNAAAHDSIESNKEKAISAMSKLLAGNPEQEKNLLSHCINKLGDPSTKIATKTQYCLVQLLKQHPNMQGVILIEVEKLLFRPNIGARAQFYCLCFLTQFYLNNENEAVPRKLIDLYFSFFKKSIKEGDVDSRLMSILLIGVNRAFPYAHMKYEQISEHVDTLYRIVHVSTFNVSLNALALLFQISRCSDAVNDRFYGALYRKLNDFKLTTATNQAIFLNLIYKAMMRDDKRTRLLSFIKRLLQICLQVSPNFACGLLFLISQIINAKRNNLYLLDTKSYNTTNMASTSTYNDADDDDEEERYVDIKDEDDKEASKDNVESNGDVDNKNDHKQENIAGSWHHCTTIKSRVSTRKNTEYDPMARNPQYANSNLSAFVELKELKNHFHPSVALFAENILNRTKIIYNGDPLKDFSLTRFFERFVYKNPKKVEELNQEYVFAKRRLYRPGGAKSIPIYSNQYIQQNKANIPVEELFIFNYLQEKYKDRKIKEKDEDDSDTDSVASDEFEDMLNNMPGFKDLENDDIDYMNDIGDKIKEGKHKGEDDDDDDDEDDEEDMGSDEELSDEDLDLEGDDDDGSIPDGDDEDDKDLFKDLDDDDESDIVFDSEEEEMNPKSSKKGKGKKKGNASIFAAAEEFASLLEDEGNANKKSGTSNQYRNTDKADLKQLNWEEKRNEWIQGYNKAIGGKKGKPKFNNKRPNNNSFKSKNKKQKRF